MEEGHPILFVAHDSDDGAWQILCGESHASDDDVRVVCLGCLVSKDPSLVQLADLPRGWCADRPTNSGLWARSAMSADDDGSDLV